MRVCTYNIRLGIQEGVLACAEVLRPWDADVIALQEVGRRWNMGPDGRTAAQIAQALGLPYHVHVPAIITEQDQRYGAALLCRWPIDVREVVDLPQAIDEPRRLLIAGIRPVASADVPTYTVLSTHLSHLDEERRAQGDLLARRAHGEARLAPTIVLGDLNEHGPAPWLDHLLEDFADATPGAHPPLTFPASAPAERRDYLLASPAAGRWSSAHVPCDPAAVAASDHFPVVADIDV